MGLLADRVHLRAIPPQPDAGLQRRTQPAGAGKPGQRYEDRYGCAGRCRQPASRALCRAHQRRQPRAQRRRSAGDGGADQQARVPPPNYEVDKTVKVVRGSTGAVKRLSAAVVVNYQSAEDKGKTVTKALTPEQIEQMTALVRETIGFNRERGDSVNLMNTPFQVTAVPTTDIPLWKQPWCGLGQNLRLASGCCSVRCAGLDGPGAPRAQGLRACQGHGRQAGGGCPARRPGGRDSPSARPWPRPAARRSVACDPGTAAPGRRPVLAKENPVAVANILKTWLNGDPA